MDTVVVLYILIFTSLTGHVKLIPSILNFVFLYSRWQLRNVDYMIAALPEINKLFISS